MTQRRLSHGKELYYIVCIVAALVSALFSFLGPGGYLEMRKVQQELETHRAQVEALKLSNSERMRTIQAFRSDKEVLERYARGKGYGKKGEIIQQLPAPADPPKE